MGNRLSESVISKLESLLNRMELTLNEEKTRQIDATIDSFNFLGFTVHYVNDLRGRDAKYWNIVPSKKSGQKIRDKIGDYLKAHGHSKVSLVVSDLNAILRGWLNYFDIEGVSYPALSKRALRYYMIDRINRYFARKSQRKCRLYGHNAFEVLTTSYGLIDPTKYARN